MILNLLIILSASKTQAVAPKTYFGLSEQFALVLIPVIASLLLFVLGYIVNILLEKVKKRTETKNYREIIFAWIELIKLPIENQIRSCIETADNISKSNDIQPEKFQLFDMLADKINSIDFDKMVSVFLINSADKGNEKESNKQIFNLISQFRFLTSSHNDMSETYKAYQMQSIDLINEWSSYYEELSRIINNWSIIAGKTTNPYFDFHKTVNQMVGQDKVQNEMRVVDTQINFLIEPLSAISLQELKKNQNHEYASELLSVTTKIKQVNEKLKILKNGFSVQFNNIAMNVENSYNSLLIARSYFKDKTKVKNIFAISK